VTVGTAFPREVRSRLETEALEIIGRYPRSRSALLPLLHLMQSEEGFVSPQAIELCAELLDIAAAEVAAVATFYTMYKRRPNGTYSVGVCTNTLCAVMGGDQIFATLKEHLGVGHDETTEDGVVTLEHLECNAACDYAPVMMVNWEFFDNQTPESAVGLVDDLRAGRRVTPTRGATLCTFKEVSRVLAGFPDGRADEGPAAGPATLAGLQIFRRQQEEAAPVGTPAAEAAPAVEATPAAEAKPKGAPARKIPARKAPARKPAKGPPAPTGYGKGGGPSGQGGTADTAESDSANPTPPATEEKDGGT